MKQVYNKVIIIMIISTYSFGDQGLAEKTYL